MSVSDYHKYSFSDILVLLPEWRNWYTHTTQNRASKGLGVRVSPPAPVFSLTKRQMKVVVDNLILNFEQFHDGEKNLVILHGWGRALNEWVPIAKSISGYTVTLLDLPGFGLSEGADEALDTYGYTKLVKEFLRKIEINKCVLVGHSFGGRIATIIAAENPEMIEKLVLVDSGGIEIKSVKIRAKIVFYKVFLKPIKKLIPKGVRRLYGSSDYRVLSGILRQSFIKIVNQDLRYLFSRIKVPVLVLWGSNDRVLPVSYVKIYRSLIMQAGIRIIWEADHRPYITKPKEFLQILKEYI